MASPKYTCILDDCDRPAYKNKMCTPHKARVKKYGSPTRPCEGCGDDLSIGTPGNRTLCDKCRVCSYPGCGLEQRRYGYCNSHSLRITRNGTIKRGCWGCGQEIPLEAGLGQRYCSDVCRDGSCAVDDCDRAVLAHGYCKRHYRRATITGHPLRKCAGCGVDLPVEFDGRVRYCGDECKPKCEAPECGELAQANGYCGRHWCIVYRDGELPELDYECVDCGKFVERSYGDRQQRKNRLRCDDCRVLRYREHQTYRRNVQKVGKADCGICDDPIDFDLKYPDPFSLSIDHIVPLSRGGTNNEYNLQPSHLRCNFKKRNNIAPPIEGALTLF